MSSTIKTQQFNISGMHCASCTVLVERALKKVPGVREVKVDLETGQAKIAADQELDFSEITRALANTDYVVTKL